MPTEYEKMIAGDFYKPSDPKLRALAASSREKQWAFNAEPDRLKRAEIVKSWFGSTGENVAMNPQFVTDYGVNIHIGENFYSNWNLTMLDICPITIGDNAMIGPNCQFLTPCIRLIQPSVIQALNMVLQLRSVIISGPVEA